MRRFSTLLTTAALAAAASFPLSGCGSSSGEVNTATLPVKGVVTYKGKPLTSGVINFEPEAAGTEAHGAIGPDGSFTLTSYKDGDGAVAGPHRVAVSGTSKKDGVPAKYKNVSSSGVVVEVAEGKAEYRVDLP
ncbi:hypothetical protein OJF2_76220 [Aquisphaera giovannonii]|uniref:Carboxypeptidase regulatory-like domain-containing protein n=1 Tax=Aquisphaera giovannonii TaxID=406548 RepID=A0A5B9WGP1_9BACT|nr:hypothetical protein [Aquisphaera giovannonii]QEH39010.1 hypothetical protein OJF2_76220 [Aquisphaera giovannonii]